MIIALAFLLGIVAGLRSMTALAAVAWAAHFGGLSLDGRPLAFLQSGVARYLLLAAMLGELVTDKLPFTPARTGPGPFAARITSGALSGAAVTVAAGGSLILGGIAGVLGALAGTLGGYRARTGLVRRLEVPDYVIAVLEDVVAVGLAFLVITLRP
jgi:uncharacterized membrane protein